VSDPPRPAITFDENGWAVGSIAPMAREAAFTLFSAESSAAFDASAIAARGRDHGLTLSVEPPKRYRTGIPLADAGFVEVATTGSAPVRVLVVTIPIERARAVAGEALAVAQAVGGGGMDALVRRARRVWQIEAGADLAAATAVAAALSSVRSAAIFPPDGGPLFGPRTAWERRGG
jgi:hypothetical protein